MEKDLRQMLIDFLNDKIDIPLMNEEQEEKFFSLLIDVIISAIPGLIAKIGL